MTLQSFKPTSVGTTAERPVSPDSGWTHLNTDTSAYEFFNGSSWVALSSATVGTETFQWESGRIASFTSNPGSWLSFGGASFSSTFDEPPLVFLMHENASILNEQLVLDTSLSGFKVNGPTFSGGVQWIAVKAGKWNIGNGVIVNSGKGAWVSDTVSTIFSDIPFSAANHMPPVFSQLYSTFTTTPSFRRNTQFGRFIGDTGIPINVAPQKMMTARSNTLGDEDSIAFLSVTATSPVTLVNSGGGNNEANLSGAKGTFGTVDYEAATVFGVGSGTSPIINYNSAFSTAPNGICRGETRGPGRIDLYCQHRTGPTTTQQALEISSVDPTQTSHVINIFMMEPGFGSISTAIRLD